MIYIPYLAVSSRGKRWQNSSVLEAGRDKRLIPLQCRSRQDDFGELSLTSTDSVAASSAGREFGPSTYSARCCSYQTLPVIIQVQLSISDLLKKDLAF